MEVATEIEMNLALESGTQHIGTGYFPFPVRATGSTKLYRIDERVKKEDGITPVMVYYEIENSSVPANTPFVVIGDNPKVTLSINYDGIAQADATETPKNLLAGHLRTDSEAEGVYVLQQK